MFVLLEVQIKVVVKQNDSPEGSGQKRAAHVEGTIIKRSKVQQNAHSIVGHDSGANVRTSIRRSQHGHHQNAHA
jgi:hypothetical protein